MKKNILILFIISNSVFCQEINREKEIKETLEWINSKMTEYQYEDSTLDLKQLCNFTNVENINNEYYLKGIREQKSTKSWDFKYSFAVPISKINNITFTEKTSNYWLVIKMKNNEKAIIVTEVGRESENRESLVIILSKSIDDEDLKPRLLKAFNHICELYGNKKNEKF